jgi:hypothetical protein
MGSEAGIEFDGEHMGRARDKGRRDGPCAGANFNHRAAGEVAERGGNALDGLRVVEEVLSEPRFGGHGLN